MYNVIFYEDSNGNEPIRDFIDDLQEKSVTNKDARINFNKIIAYIRKLEQYGFSMCEPFIKHLKDDIWELRPIDNRILYAYYKDNTFILLHHFTKTTNKTPPQEIEQAKRNLKDYFERNG